MSIDAKPESGDADLFGKTVSELQSNVDISGDKITGTLNYVTGYTGFHGDDPTEQEGNYLALKFATKPEDAVTVVELVGGTKGPVTLDSDMNIVLLVRDVTKQSIKVTATKNTKSESKTYDISGLTLTPKPTARSKRSRKV